MARDKDIPQVWEYRGGNGGAGHGRLLPRDMTSTEFAEFKFREATYDAIIARQQAYEERYLRQIEQRQQAPGRGCVFAKSCNLLDGVIDHNNPAGFIPTERLAEYGQWAVLGSQVPISAEGVPLKWVAGSGTGRALGQRLGGSLGLSLLSGASAAGTLALLIPNTDISSDSAFYTNEQYAQLTSGRTRVRFNAKTLPDGSISAYGFYTGGKKDWEFVPVIKARQEGEHFVADLGHGIGLTWTPAADPDDAPSIPALEGAPPLPTIWVYPPGEKTDRILVNPQHPPDYHDAIVWFPADAGLAPIYVVLSTRYEPGIVTGVGEDVEGRWLDTARSGLGAPIPTNMASQLRGRRFSSFDTFRRAFWTAVSKRPELSSQFSRRDLDRMRAGKAPRVDISDVAGSRISHEIHHVALISEGGPVYDVDNMRVNTPRNHIDVHQN
ncbi:S-type pyocin domain-containing protein [Pseudomonas pharyngis]|uniref:S-type pyocin domain-containing protein n=1 Tax=Pseudomonas pharyngis TaxID=2892333 RepID=UPI003FCFBE45